MGVPGKRTIFTNETSQKGRYFPNLISQTQHLWYDCWFFRKDRKLPGSSAIDLLPGGFPADFHSRGLSGTGDIITLGYVPAGARLTNERPPPMEPDPSVTYHHHPTSRRTPAIQVPDTMFYC